MSKWCTKICYPSRQAAKRAITAINRYLKGNRPLKSVYYCDECQEWHTTSMSKPHSRDVGRHIRKAKGKGKKKK